MDSLGDWIDEHCKCKTCVHAVEADLFGSVRCEHPELDGLGWLPPDSLCECHDFADPALAAELERQMEHWYAVEYANDA